jgi:hypothetical protein
MTSSSDPPALAHPCPCLPPPHVQVTIQERDFVIASHQRSETALAGHAEAVTAELGGAAAELASLLGTLQATAQLQQGDRCGRGHRGGGGSQVQVEAWFGLQCSRSAGCGA